MDSFDAIRDQLERRFESLKSRIEEAVQALDQARSSLQETLTEPPDQALGLEEIRASLDRPEEGAAPGAGQIGITLDQIRRLDAPRSQSELLHELMAILTDHAARAAVLVFRDGHVTAWSGVGFAESDTLRQWHGLVATSPLLAAMAEDPKPYRCVPGEDPLMSQWLSGLEDPHEALLIPVSLRGKLMGAVYADHLAGRPWNPGTVQALVALGCWLIDSLHHRSQVPTPMIADLAEASEAAEVAVSPPPEPVIEEPVEQPVVEEFAEPPEAPIAEPEPELEMEFDEVGATAAPPVVEEPAEFGVPEPEVEIPEPAAAEEPDFAVSEPEMIEEPESLEAGFDPSATVQVDLGEVQEEMEIAEPQPSEEMEFDVGVEAPAVTPEAVEAPPVEVPPVEAPPVEAPPVEAPPVEEEPVETPEPPPVQPVTPPVDVAAEPPVEAPEAAPQLSAEEETRHEEARRFARLLVSEIKLYNEEEVDRGRVNRDLYQRLKEDIDRSREMYEKRISPDIRATRDYFHEELVRILADGDPDALGM
jgi:hypothetical protein